MIIEPSAIGPIAIPDSLPDGFALFYTTSEFPGRLDAGTSASIRGVIRERFGIDAALTTCNQVHGATVRQAYGGVRHEPSWAECESCDALWSGDRNAALGIKVADCLPITMIDPTHAVIANVHSGWRGGVQQIGAVTVKRLTAETSFDPAGTLAYLGPSIRACCFEVGDEVVAQFAASYGDIEQFVDRSRNKPHLDLPAITTASLLAHGFAAERIIDSRLCTRCEGSIFHSYRRQGLGGGRNLALVAQ